MKRCITFNDRDFSSQLDLLMYLIQTNNTVQEELFLGSDNIFSWIALENKFNREFTFEEITEILKDKSWQWRNTLQNESLEGLTHVSQ